MRKKVLIVFTSVFVLLLLVGGFYFGLAKYYAKGFSFGTWINGIYCTGKSVEEVEKELKSQFAVTELVLSFEDGTKAAIALDELEYSIDYEEGLQLFLERQNPYLWILNLQNETQLLPVISYNEEKLTEAIENLPAVAKAEEKKDRRVEIVKTQNGYKLVNEKEHVLDAVKLTEQVKKALKEGPYEIKVEETCYKDLTLTEKESGEVLLWNQVQEFQNCKIRYDMGDEIVPIDAAVVCEWIVLDEEGNFLLDENGKLQTDEKKIKEFIDKLAAEFDTVGAERSFRATRGETVTVCGGTYGNKIDKKAETSYLTEAFLSKADEVHVPKYTQEAVVRGKEDIGNTYIEIDMTQQMMYYYVDGELYVETAVVTGNTGRRMGTPEGTCFVYGKQKNRVLRGPNYASFVNFWVPVRGNIGIHDAPWRSEYGGEIYKTSGSHGCVNTPYDEMEIIYDRVEIGTPVVMFY